MDDILNISVEVEDKDSNDFEEFRPDYDSGFAETLEQTEDLRAVDNGQMNVELEDELDTPNDVINPSLEADLERNDFQGGERHGETVGLTQTRKDCSPKEQALLKEALTPYTVCLEKILLSDGDGLSFLLDHVLQIISDLMSWLAGLHDKSIVYGDVRAGNIFINDHMRAFLINSDKSKEQNNKAALLDESLIDVKAMCAVMGGLCEFYRRMRPRDSQNSKQAETALALFALLRRGYKYGISAKDFLEELGRIVVDDQVGEHEEAPRQLPIKKISELGSMVVNGQGRSMNSLGSVPRPEAISNKVPLQASRDTNNGNKSRDKTSKLDSRAMEDHCSTDGTATHADRVSEQKGAGAVTNKIPEQVPEAHVSNQVPLQASGANNEGPGNKARDKTSGLDSRAMEDHCSTDGTTTHADRVSEQKGAGAVTNKIPELGSAVVNSQGSEQVPEAYISNQVPVPASVGATNNEGPQNNSRDKTSGLDSREMEDGYSTDGESIHETLMAVSEMERFQSE